MSRRGRGIRRASSRARLLTLVAVTALGKVQPGRVIGVSDGGQAARLKIVREKPGLLGSYARERQGLQSVSFVRKRFDLRERGGDSATSGALR